VWIDLASPTPQECHAVELSLGLALPTHEEMRGIETSSRLYFADNATYMTADVVTKADSMQPQTHAVTFILTRRQLVTLRFADAAAFSSFEAQATSRPGLLETNETALLGLVETVIEQVGQLLRNLVTELESISKIVFWDPMAKEDRMLAKTVGLKSALYGIGHSGEISSRAQQSLLSIERLLAFYMEAAKPKAASALAVRVATVQRDVRSLSEHASFLSQKIGFLMDATMGLINAEQNQIIKIFSVGAVIFLPPTLIASIYGMNFVHMPELAWPWGYPLALFLMALAGVIPYAYFKHRKWI
jgi:magnesium transporter